MDPAEILTTPRTHINRTRGEGCYLWQAFHIFKNTKQHFELAFVLLKSIAEGGEIFQTHWITEQRCSSAWDQLQESALVPSFWPVTGWLKEPFKYCSCRGQWEKPPPVCVLNPRRKHTGPNIFWQYDIHVTCGTTKSRKNDSGISDKTNGNDYLHIAETSQLYQHAAAAVGFLWHFPACPRQTCWCLSCI